MSVPVSVVSVVAAPVSVVSVPVPVSVTWGSTHLSSTHSSFASQSALDWQPDFGDRASGEQPTTTIVKTKPRASASVRIVILPFFAEELVRAQPVKIKV